MTGNVLAYVPCFSCGRKEMCSMCELILRRNQIEWISVEERLPDEDGEYLAYTRRGSTVLSYYYALEGTFSFEHWDVTHWMPLPKAPKKGESNEAD